MVGAQVGEVGPPALGPIGFGLIHGVPEGVTGLVGVSSAQVHERSVIGELPRG